MGMYDTYEPIPAQRCPWCDGRVLVWQGKDGPNALFLWRQGAEHPVDQPIDKDVRIGVDRYVEFRLPDRFTIGGRCENDHVIEASCRCSDGVWIETDLSSERAKVEEKLERDRRHGLWNS